MVAKMPGAIWRPIIRNFTNRKRSRTRAVVLHVAVSEAASLHDWFNNPAAGASSHFYVRRDGTTEQYIDADLISWANGDGNPTTLTVETQGMGHGEWTEAQIDALAKICKWANQRYGVPLVAMRDARPSTSGIGYHRLGVPGYKTADSENWSSSPGKICPGPERIAQVPTVIARAEGITAFPADPAPTSKDWFDMADKNDLKQALREVLGERIIGPVVIKSPGAKPDTIIDGGYVRKAPNAEQAAVASKTFYSHTVNPREFDVIKALLTQGEASTPAAVIDALKGQEIAPEDVAAALAPAVITALDGLTVHAGSLTTDDIRAATEEAVRAVFTDAFKE